MAVKVFVSYAHEDGGWLDSVFTMLKSLENDGIVEAFSDRLIQVGDEWNPKIQAEIDEADLVILLVTPEFLASEYIYLVEVEAALRKHDLGNGRILPIIIKDCDWENKAWAKINAWPLENSVPRPLAEWPIPEKALKQISQEVRQWASNWRPTTEQQFKVQFDARADLECQLVTTLSQLLQCSRTAATKSNFATDLPVWAETLIEYAQDSSVSAIVRTQFLCRQLMHHKRNVREHLLAHHFEAIPIARTLAHLEAFCSDTADAADTIDNTTLERPERRNKILWELRDAVDLALSWVDGQACTLSSSDRAPARRYLRELKIGAHALDVDPRELNELRAGLEPFNVDTLDRCVIITQALLGCDAAQLPPGTVFRDANALWAPEMVVIPAGTFLMGSARATAGGTAIGETVIGDGVLGGDVLDKSLSDGETNECPRHRVTIDSSFAVGRYPVTFDEYDHFTADPGVTKPNDQAWGRGRRPVINLSIEDRLDYLTWLSRQTQKNYRLPSEAEWEYACRAGTSTRYSFGDEMDQELANYDENIDKTSKVGSYPPNSWGLFDMHGNVWELCADTWHDSYQSAPNDGSAWIENESVPTVWRGGSWGNYSWDCRSACRRQVPLDVFGWSAGLRVVRSFNTN